MEDRRHSDIPTCMYVRTYVCAYIELRSLVYTLSWQSLPYLFPMADTYVHTYVLTSIHTYVLTWGATVQ